ncbi:hypothetical protein VNI00_018098 [Paramarasmius palmivorus]|uniref:Uncharacterized protein n=1 Tax=Paramarasmius palmivorus TaxID=297713 RepID=A0AAW0B2T7_9AGAR
MDRREYLRRLTTARSAVRDTPGRSPISDRALIMSLANAPTLLEQFRQHIQNDLAILQEAGGDTFDPETDFTWLADFIPELDSFLQSHPPPATSNATPVPSSTPQPTNNQGFVPPPAAPISGSFTIPTQVAGNMNQRRVNSYQNRCPQNTTVLGGAMAAARSHALDPLSVSSVPSTSLRKIGIMIHPLLVSGPGRIPEGLESHPPTYDPATLHEVITHFKSRALYTYMMVPSTGLIRSSDITCHLRIHLGPHNIQMPAPQSPSLSSDPDSLVNQPFRILDFTKSRNPDLFRGKPSMLNDNSLTYPGITGMNINKKTSRIDVNAATNEEIPVLFIAPAHGHLQAPLTNLTVDPSEVPLDLQAQMHQCFAWRILSHDAGLLYHPPQETVATRQQCLPSPMCPRPTERPSTPPRSSVNPSTIPQCRPLQLSPSSQPPLRQVRSRPTRQQEPVSSQRSASSTAPASVQNTPTSTATQVSHPTPPPTSTNQEHRPAAPQVRSLPPPLSEADMVTFKQLSQWEKRVKSPNQHLPVLKCEFASSNAGAHYLATILQHLSDPATSSSPLPVTEGTLVSPTNPVSLRSFFGANMQVTVNGSPGPGPRRQIFTVAAENLKKRGWEHASGDSPFIVPRLPTFLTDDAATCSRLRGDGALLASMLFQYKVAPLPVSPWVMFYLLSGADFVRQIPPTLIEALDPAGFAVYSPILQLKPNEERPMQILHPINQFLITVLETQPSHLPPRMTQEDIDNTQSAAFAAVFFNMKPERHPFQHPGLIALREGFCVRAGPGNTTIVEVSLSVSREFNPKKADRPLHQTLQGLPPAKVVGRIYNLFPSQMKDFLRHIVVGIAEPDLQDPCICFLEHQGIDDDDFLLDTLGHKHLPLYTKLFQYHLHRFLSGTGVPTTFSYPGTASQFSDTQLSDPFFRAKLFLMTSTALPNPPATPNWKIEIKTTNAPLNVRGRSLSSTVVPPLLFHTCTREIDVHINAAMREMLVKVPLPAQNASEKLPKGTVFDGWLFEQISHKDRDFNTV